MKKEITPAENIINNVCKIKKNESVLIIANPATDFIAQELYTAANQAGAKTSLIYQNSKYFHPPLRECCENAFPADHHSP